MSIQPQLQTFMDLVANHRSLSALFERHMEALLLLDTRLATTLLERYRAELAVHIAAEEEVLLPLYAERAGEVPGGTVEIFVAEHRKMLDMLKSLIDRCHGLEPTPRTVLALLDSEFTFKHLFDHHDAREARLLYFWMDRLTTPEERRTLLRRFDELSVALSARDEA